LDRGDYILEINPYLWAKKSEKNSLYWWLPLRQHLEDARRVSERLWELWLNDGQRQLVVDSLSQPTEESAKQLVEFLAAVHDIAKATPAFQIKQGFANSKDLDIQLLERLERDGFAGISKLKLPSPSKSHHALAGQTILAWYGVNDDINSIISGHHGKPIDKKWEYEEQNSYLENYFQEEISNSLVYKKWETVQKEIFEWALKTSGMNNVNDLPEISQTGQVILSGLLIMADWIASNEDFFPLFSIDKLEVEDQASRFANGWIKWFKSFPWDTEGYSEPEELYSKRFGFEPRDVQEKLSDVIEKTTEPGIFILEAPMGVGKTEAALVGVEQLAQKTGRNGLFFGLPTQATSNGIFPRINSWLSSIKDDAGENLPIRLAHGKAALNKDFSSLARNVDIDGEDNGTVFVNEWFSGRKTSALDDFVVGTVDQFLLLALKQKHLALRHLGFSKKVVIIDEVHAYDSYMNQYLLRAIQWMGAYGVPVVILSATLPAESRRKLVKNYVRGKGIKWSKNQMETGLFQTDIYPLITYTDNKEVKQFQDFAPAKSNSVDIKRYEEQNLDQLLDNLSQTIGVIGIIVNTVKRAQELAKKCVAKYGSERVELLHSSFITTDRIKKENELIKMIGKDADRPKQKIIIGTQVMEQSLDIDFDVLISDLAPMDLLIQRVGRLHRHDIQRPAQFGKPVLYVLGTDQDFEFESGSEFVYGGYLLARTQYYLPEVLTLPDDISTLVQKVYGENDIEIPAELEEKYFKMRKKHDEKLKNKKDKADVYRLNSPARKSSPRKNTLIGWLDSSAKDKGEEHASAQVRDSQDTLEIIALKKTENGYGTFDEAIDLSNQIDDFNVSKRIAKHTLRLPYALSYPSIIDDTIEILEKENKKYLSDWQEQPWLKGSLGIIFNEDQQYYLNGYILHYDSKFGLMHEKEEKNGEV